MYYYDVFRINCKEIRKKDETYFIATYTFREPFKNNSEMEERSDLASDNQILARQTILLYRMLLFQRC
jgi:hypothetical protein